MADPIVLLPVQSAYDRWSASYDSYDNPMIFAARRALAAEFSNVMGVKVFEFGCGTGQSLAFLKTRGASLLAGCDLSAGMLSVAQNNNPGFPICQADITKPLPLASHQFDLVLFCLSLEHVENPLHPLEEARRLLRPGGQIAIFEIHPFLSLTGVAAHFKDGGEEVRMPTYPHQFSTYCNAFAKLGLVAKCREWRPCDFPDAPVKVLKRGAELPILVQFTVAPDIDRFL